MKNLRSVAALILLTLLFAPNFLAAQNEPVFAGDCNGIKLSQTDMVLSFDWANETLNSKATITAYMSDNSPKRVKFSAKGNWNILSVKVNGVQSSYDRKDSTSLTVFFSATTLPGKVLVEVVYRVIKPQKGVYFINPRGTVPGQAKQIWVQGEMEDNSYWMPIREMSENCFDKTTGSVTLDIPNKFTSVSNGVKLPSKKLKGGLRRDTWQMNQPHSPYLWTFIIGEFDVVKDNTGRVPIEYFVQKGYKDYAEQIFPKTRELLDFFSERFGPYPWPAYRQVIVEDFQFGAMENTSCVTFHKSFQGTDRELEGNMRNFAVVAHEMMHHWFGDLTTASGWDDFTLNEGFATYSEWIAIKHFYGEEAAFEWFEVGRDQYFDQCKNDAHPLIDPVRANKNCHDMFDRHSYKKGGWVLRQLNEMLGDSIFNASSRYYLAAHYFGYAEWSDLEYAFEAISGQELSWYFKQWGYKTGHPVIEANWAYMSGNVVVGLHQAQYPKWNLFTADIPIVLVYKDGTKLETNLVIDSITAFKTYVIAVKEKPQLVLIDPNRIVLAQYKWNMSLKEYEKIAVDAEEYFPTRIDMMDSLIVHRTEIPHWNDLCKGLMQEDEPRIRARGVEFVDNQDWFTQRWVTECATKDESYLVRKMAVSRLTNRDTLLSIFSHDNSLEVASLALTKLAEVDSVKGLEIANWVWDIIQQEKVPHERFGTKALATIFANTGDIKYSPYFKSVCETGGPYPLMEFEGMANKPGPMITWLQKLQQKDRESFLIYLSLFNDRFKITNDFFAPKVFNIGSSGK